MARDVQGGAAHSPKVVALRPSRKTSLGLTFLEFAHTLVLMLWVGSLAGFALVVIPVLITSLPSRDLVARATVAILERTAFLGCGAGAFLLLTTLLMHLLSLRATRTSLVQMLLLLTMTGAAVVSEIAIAPRVAAILTRIPAGLDSLEAYDASRVELGRLQNISLAILLFQIASGTVVLLFAVRRWYHYLPVRRASHRRLGTSLDPRIR